MHVRRSLICAISVFAVVAASLLSGPSVWADPTPELLDLPAMTLTPADIEGFGLEGFGRFGNGEFRGFDDYVERRASFLNVPAAEVAAALEEAGWLAGYVSNLGLPSEPGNPESRSAQIAFTSVYQYADANGAEAGYDFNRRYDGVDVEQFEVLPGTQQLGDASYLTHTIFPGGDDDRPSNQLDLSLRRGNIVAATGLIVFTDLGETDRLGTATADDIALVEALGARLLERIASTLDGGGPDLSTRIARLDASNGNIPFATEGYRRLNGDDQPYYGGFADDFPGGSSALASTVAVYEINQGIAAPGDPYYVARILRFGGPDAAADYLAEVRGRGQSPFGAPAKAVEGAASFGDESVTFAYEDQTQPGVTISGYVIYARIGEMAVMILLESTAGTPELGDAEALAEAQIACLDGGCPSSVPLPHARS